MWITHILTRTHDRLDPYTTRNIKINSNSKTMNREIKYEDLTGNMRGEGVGGVFVSDLSSYTVTDDLRVMPNSPDDLFACCAFLLDPRQEASVNRLTSNETLETLKSFKLKVTIQKSTSKFLFAEADSDFVQFVFGFLQIPLGTMIGDLLNGTSCFENLNNMFKSISNTSVGKA
ncbi:hypothetical protein Hanom_Chr00s138005g01817991 [Helianthus anomalus]